MAKKQSDYKLDDPGWMNDAELDRIVEEVGAAVKRIAPASPSPAVLEVGCYAGRTTRALLRATSGLVITVDPLDRNRAMPRWPTPDGAWIETRRHIEALVAERGAGRLIVIPCFAEEVFALVRPPLTALVIDTEHSYEPQIRQIDAWAPLVLDGGVIVFDDYDLEPVASAWRDCAYHAARPWLAVEVFESLGIVHVSPT